MTGICAVGNSAGNYDKTAVFKRRPVDSLTQSIVLAGKVETGEIVAIIGGELVGCVTVDFLAQRGKKVTILRRGPEMLTKMETQCRPRLLLLDKLSAKGVTMLTRISYKQITDRGVVCRPSAIMGHRKASRRLTLTFDTKRASPP